MGIADDIVTSTLLATETPKFIAPAMNVHMYENKRTQHNISVLKTMNIILCEPGDGFSMWVHCKGTYGGTSSNCQNHK